ncbi:hypothetical protein CAEBREN_25338 [Caenorhabditis brenneri]|uniref:Uncharacterized protein n=1 Tax=Caenorhabditis brenneri TaxID=135651 RepID=G0P1B1_CAEBE|nr:hypothetical protein CAEBREN_25338 [Caenorhabditis brenneri]
MFLQLRGVIEADILLHQLRLDNNHRDIPFTLYLQLTISTFRSDGVEILSIERMKYTRNLGAATKYLIKRLLNKPMNYVTRIIISPLSNIDCYWLPAEMKLAARYLIICNYHELVMRTVGQFLRHINQRPFETIAFHLRDAPKRYHYYIDLINNLVFRAAPVGTHYTAHTSLTQGFIICNRMKELEGLTSVGTPTRRCQWLPDCVILPMPNNAQLEFYMTPVVDHPFTVLLNFEIQPRNN